MGRDPYDILGVPRDAGDEEIRRAYRRLAKQEHPDTDGGDENYFCRLNDAYESIRTPERRRAQARERGRVDRQNWTGPGARGQRPAWRSPPGGGAPGTARGPGARPGGRPRSIFGPDLSGLFDRMFGGGLSGLFAGSAAGTVPWGGTPGGDTRGGDEHYRLEARLTPEQARRGVSMALELGERRHQIDVPAGVRDGDVLSFSESSPGGARISVELEIVVR
ncbi:MAG: DnaJ domain-containing protein [Spirochaetes bacterium]|jgi:curved DNA-binding protein|nr:DnaJ domain-containing protein [Spirochaetota bacterium]